MTSVVTPAPPKVQAASASKPAAGEGRTLGELYDQLGTLAYGLAFSITGQGAAAERAVTAAFASTWRRRNDIARGGFFAALMTTVRANALAGRRPRRASTGSSYTDGLRALPSSSDPLEGAVALTLRGLPDAQRRVLMLAYFGGLAVGEIASQLHEPMEHVKENLQAALCRLRSLVSERSSARLV